MRSTLVILINVLCCNFYSAIFEISPGQVSLRLNQLKLLFKKSIGTPPPKKYNQYLLQLYSTVRKRFLEIGNHVYFKRINVVLANIRPINEHTIFQIFTIHHLYSKMWFSYCANGKQLRNYVFFFKQKHIEVLLKLLGLKLTKPHYTSIDHLKGWSD